jgi:hypothetical protein
MKIVIEFDTETANFEDDRSMAVSRIMQQVKMKVLESMNDKITVSRRTYVKDVNGNCVGVLEINL